MANTYSAVYHHLVFSTKNRERLIHAELEDRLWAYIGGVVRENECVPLRIGGIETHVHLIAAMSPKVATSQLVKQIKVASSHWMRANHPDVANFGWQDGYGVFSVSKSSVETVCRYIERQREHHRHKTFEEEYRVLMEKHGVDFDERYLF